MGTQCNDGKYRNGKPSVPGGGHTWSAEFSMPWAALDQVVRLRAVPAGRPPSPLCGARQIDPRFQLFRVAGLSHSVDIQLDVAIRECLGLLAQ